jgi:hypothetical protein
MELNWQLRQPARKATHDHLFYYSDEAWLQFTGFLGARVERFQYIPGLVENLMITNIPGAKDR